MEKFELNILNFVKRLRKEHDKDNRKYVYCVTCGAMCRHYDETLFKECYKCNEFKNFWRYY